MAAGAPPREKNKKPPKAAGGPRLPRVLVMGAGNLGAWLGGHMQVAGAEVHLVGRPRMLQAMLDHGLSLTDLDEGQHDLPGRNLRLYDAVPDGLRPDLVLLCVKSGATTAAATELGEQLPPGTLVLSLQSGVQNAELAQAAAPNLTVLRGVVGFHVCELGPGRLHRGSAGVLALQSHPMLQTWEPAFKQAGLTLDLHDDMRPLQWSQLTLDLNNAVNALSGQPLLSQLMDPDLRYCSAALMDEALNLLKAAGIKPARLGGVKPTAVPGRMRLPTPLFRLMSRQLLKMDERARSSMADDMIHRRPTEVDMLQGEVLRLSTRVGILAPCNARITQLVRAWSPRSAPMSGRAMRKFLNL